MYEDRIGDCLLSAKWVEESCVLVGAQGKS